MPPTSHSAAAPPSGNPSADGSTRTTCISPISPNGATTARLLYLVNAASPTNAPTPAHRRSGPAGIRARSASSASHTAHTGSAAAHVSLVTVPALNRNCGLKPTTAAAT